MHDFFRQVEAEIPRLRRYARALTRDRSRSDDLVQNCLTRAMAKEHLWQPGSNLGAWLLTIMHNQYVSEVRRSAREGTAVDISESDSILTVASNQMLRLQLHDLDVALAKLPDEQRSILLLIGLEGMSYDGAAQVLDIPVGTVRSRLSHARAQLRKLMEGNPLDGNPPPTKINRRAVRHRAA